MSGVQDRLQAVPVGTLALVLVNVAVHCAVFITSFNPGLLAISAYQVVYLHEVRLQSRPAVNTLNIVRTVLQNRHSGFHPRRDTPHPDEYDVTPAIGSSTGIRMCLVRFGCILALKWFTCCRRKVLAL